MDSKAEWPDLGYDCEYESEELCIHFKVYNRQRTNSLTGHDLVAEGYLKWDGCANIDMGTDSDHHFCNAEQVAQFGEMLNRVYALGKLEPFFDY